MVASKMAQQVKVPAAKPDDFVHIGTCSYHT